MSDPCTLSALEAITAVAQAELTVAALVDHALARIAEIEPRVGAWQHLDAAQARDAAGMLDRNAAAGPLRGMLVGVKDVIDTVQMPTSYGSRAYAGFRPACDAAVVARLRAAGALVMGKTVTTEFAAGGAGQTRNPYNPAHTPGGSSSGSAAAVATGMVHVALGTQTAGSVIRPAAFCGVVGYKPSHELIDRSGAKTLAGSFDTIGVLARAVRDVAFFTGVVSDRPGLAVPDTPAAPRVALYRSEAAELIEPATEQALQRAVAALAARGVKVPERPLLAGYDDLLRIHADIAAWEVRRVLFFEQHFLADLLHPVTRAMYAQGTEGASAARHDAAQRDARVARANVDALFGDADVLLTPAAPGEAPVGLERTGDPSFCRGWMVLGAPCITIPAGFGSQGLPVGVQLVGRPGDDACLLRAAAFLEAALAA
ncbi:amidase [Sphingobium sp. H39-3-25]|uniref:amidase n=1 Tax=Sphingobium arseniciresistens TaxID=3030834 RepID=UPI0023B92CFC|nr:amidase [Sphingobium arseniciresistens]